jgi:ABC-type bacteriocin/lantibiotic exporter with double-glycine peptidase domain
MTNLPTISFKDVTFGFDGKPVLNHFSFDAQHGKHTVLRGESGSGKSTVLQLLLGFYRPSSGSILFNNKVLNFQDIRKRTSWLPQDLNLGSGTVQDVIAQPFEFAQNKSRENEAKEQKKILQNLGMDPQIMTKQFRDLSTGQRQRIGLAICYLLDKPLLLLDEPTSSLDKVSKQKVADLLLTNEKTIISTSHDPFWVNHADKIIDIT